MPINKSIGTRVFGLALLLLTFTIALVGFLLWQVSRLQEELQLLTHRNIPLASSFSRLDEYGLRRRLAFERMFGALNLNPPNEQILAEAQTNYDLFTKKLNDEIATGESLLEDAGEQEIRGAELTGFSELLKQIRAAYDSIIPRQQEVLELQRKGDHEHANLLLNGLNDLQSLVQSQRAQLQNATAHHAEKLAKEALGRQGRITSLTLAATASTVLLGLLIAAWVTQGLVRPVRRLIGAMHDVQDGHLDLELPVRGNDEIGALTSAFNFFVRELRSKAEMKETFGKYVDPRILERVLKTAGPVDGDGDRQVMTIGFGDLVGFTGCSERLTPSSMVRMLNRHFGLQADAIQEHLGIVDKFIGDSVMAFWGPPFVSPTEHAALACRSALAQIAALDVLRAELPELTGLRRDAPGIDLRIGLASGEVIVGNLGADHTRNYTVIGDTVNIASRIESANRIYGTRILVSDSVVRDVSAEFELREVDSIAVKGRQDPACIYELLGLAGCLGQDGLLARESYADGLRAYRAGDWDAARGGFEKCIGFRPDDRAARTMIERVVELRSNPPGKSWDGVWMMTAK